MTRASLLLTLITVCVAVVAVLGQLAAVWVQR